MAAWGFEDMPSSAAAARALATMVAAYAVGTAWHAWRGLRAGLADRWSAVGCSVVMALLAAAVWAYGEAAMPGPFLHAAGAGFLGGAVVTVTYTLARFEARIRRFRRVIGERMAPYLERIVPEQRLQALRELRERAGHEERRKGVHLTMGFFVGVYLFAGHYVVGAAALALSGTAGSNLEIAYLGPWLVAGHLAAMFGMFLVLGIIAPTELLRMAYPELSYPFKQVLLTTLRRREAGLFGAHYYIAAAMPFAVLWLCRDPDSWQWTIPAVAAVFGVTVFADAASAIVGVRWGRTKWFHNPGKSYAGSAAGVVVGFAAALPFVGPSLALGAAAVFLLVDVAAPVPIPVSDNVLNPLAMGLLLVVGEGAIAPAFAFY